MGEEKKKKGIYRIREGIEEQLAKRRREERGNKSYRGYRREKE